MTSTPARDKRTLRIIGLLFVVIVALTFVEIFLQGADIGSRYITNNIVVFVVVNIHVVLFMVLVILVARNLVKLWFERRRRTPGSRFKTRLILAFTAFSAIPVLLLFIGSLVLINRSIHNWFDTRVEEALKGTTDIARVYYEGITQDTVQAARRVAGGIGAARMMSRRNPDALMSYIGGRQREYSLTALQVLDLGGREYVAVSEPGTTVDALSEKARRLLPQVLGGEEATLVEPAGGGDVVRAMVPVRAGPGSREVRGVLVASTVIPAGVARKVHDIISTYESYTQAKNLKDFIRFSYQALLTMSTLVWLFMSTWFAFYLARLISVPIQLLVEGTRRVSAGDLDVRIEPTSDDELAVLIHSFNHMTTELKAGQSKLESAYRKLERGNVELDARKRYIETVLNTIATGVFSLDAAGRVTTLNMAAQAMLGLDPGPPGGRDYREVFGGEQLAAVRAVVEELGEGSTERVERKVDLPRDGVPLTLLVIGSSLADEGGQSRGGVFVLENLTELATAQRVAAWREVARRIAHEIKNPLTPIKLSAQRLRKKYEQKSPDFARVFEEGTTVIIDQVDELRRLVDEFSRFARMPAGQQVPTDLHALLEATVKRYRETAGGIEFVFRAGARHHRVAGDPEGLRRAFVNLIDNSVEAMEGKGTVTVETTDDPAAHLVRVVFKDDGPGISPQVRDKLFVPYFSTKKEGTGLGLTIVSSIVADHHGYLRVKNNSPRGTSFVLELPVLRDDTTGGANDGR